MRDLAAALSSFVSEPKSTIVQDLRIDSRAVVSGDVFVALHGHLQNGEDYINDAFERGATCALIDADSLYKTDSDKVIRVPSLDRNIAHIAASFYQHPSTHLKLVGVTGTNGKSTITAMISSLANASNTPSAVVGTLGYGDITQLTPLLNTTPSHIDLQRILNELSDTNDLVAMEVSSHALMQKRVEGCDFDVAVFSNLSRDHLDYHGTMQAYAEAKLKLFKDCKAKACIINADDTYAQLWLETHTFDGLVVYGAKPAHHSYEHYVWFDQVIYTQNGISASLTTSWGNSAVELPLFGEFNLYNFAAAIGALLVQGYSLDSLIQASHTLLPVPGRMEMFSSAMHPVCIVDYAHTPDALSLALRALQHHVPGKVVCVFGCGGDRDKGKRALMAQAAEQFADKVIITSDNPRSEPPEEIIKDIKAGLSQPEYAYCEPDRAMAIRYAIEQSSKDSVILVAGKGHEDYQIIGTQRIEFCDRKWVKTILEGGDA